MATTGLSTADAIAQENIIAKQQGTQLQPVPVTDPTIAPNAPVANNLPQPAPVPVNPNLTAQPSVNAPDIGNVKQMNLPNVGVNTSNQAAAGVIGGATAENQILQDEQAKIDKAQQKLEAEQATQKSYIQKLLGKGERTQELEAEANLSPQRQIAQAITQEYQTKTLAQNARFQEIMNRQGQSMEGKLAEINALTRNHALEMSDLSIRQNIAQGNYQAAQSMVDRKIEIEYGDLKDLIGMQSQVLRDAGNDLSDKEKTKLNILLQNNQREYEEKTYQAHALQDFKTKAIINAQEMNAPASVIAMMQSATDTAGVAKAGGRFFGGLDAQIKRAQLRKIESDIKSTTSGGTQVFSESLNKYASLGKPEVNKQVLSAILGGKQVQAGTKGRIAPANEVLNALDEFATQRPEGKFIGSGGFLGFAKLKEGIKGIFNAKNTEAIQNSQSFDAIKLKVEQWASGASLTDEQTKAVKRLVPTTWDSDKEIKIKTSGLYNYMLNNVESNLLTDGVNVNFAPVDLFGGTIDPLGVVSAEANATTDPLNIN
jgi:hypothetical protein